MTPFARSLVVGLIRTRAACQGGGPSLVFFPNIQSGDAPSFAHVAKGGNHTAGAMGFGLNCVGTGSMTNATAATASCPTLAKSARMGHPRSVMGSGAEATSGEGEAALQL
jgi:hypothetical protein